MTIQIKYAQSYMQTNGQMTIDVLFASTESTDLVIGIDPYSSDVPPKPIGPRFLMCLPANQPCFMARLLNVSFNDPFNLYIHRCISGPNCGAPSCTTFSSTTDSSYTGTMVDFSGAIPSATFGSPHPVSSSIQSTCGTAPPPSKCQPPNNLSYYCDKTGYGYVWNQSSCKYDYGALNDATYHCGVAPPPTAGTFTLSATKSVINIGDTISFTGNYYLPNTTISLYYETVIAGVAVPYRNHLATTMTDASGSYFSSMIMTTIIPGTIRVGACSPGSLGFECGSDLSNTVDISVTSTAPTGTSIDISKTSYALGDTVSIKSCAPSGYVYVLDPSGTQTFKADIPANGCRTDTYIIATGQPNGNYTIRVANYSNVTLIEKQYSVSTSPSSVSLVLKANKTTITTGDTVTFTGTYSPNKAVNIFIEGLVRTHLTQVTTDNSGSFVTSLQITNEGSLQIKACNAGFGFECALFPDVSQAVSLVVNPVSAVSFTFYTDKTLIADGENLTVFGTYKPNTQINIYYQTIVAGVAVPYRNHFATVNTDSTGKYLTAMIMSVSVAGTIRIGACSLGGFGFECGSDVSSTVDITVTAALPSAFTLVADKSAIKSGDIVTFTGKYSPGKKINIYIDTWPKTHVTTVTTDTSGNYSTSAKLTTTTLVTANIGACTVSALPGQECEIGGASSNIISISITPPGVAPPPTTGLKWKLNPDLTCTQPTDGSGTYATKDLCLVDAAKNKGGTSSSLVIVALAALVVGRLVLDTTKKE